MSSFERTNWRDQGLSERHRGWGLDLPAVDLDFVLVEYDTSKPAALIEYKQGDPRPLDFEHPSYRALRHLADASRIPFCIAFYSPLWSFTVYPCNDYALEWFTAGERLSELEYVRRLYAMRGRELPAEIEVRMNDVLPQEAQNAA